MRFLTISSKIYVSAAVFYSTFSLSKCRAGDIPELPLRHDEFVHIYKTEIPWTPIEFEERKNNFAFVAWVAILSVAVCTICIVCLFCVCWRLCPKLKSRRQSSNTALMPSAPDAIVVFQADASAEAGRRIRNPTTTTNNIYGNGVVNFAFTGSRQDPVPYPPNEDGPPEYAAVVSQIPPNDRPANNAPYPLVGGTKTVETPPPAYISVAPFQ